MLKTENRKATLQIGKGDRGKKKDKKSWDACVGLNACNRE